MHLYLLVPDTHLPFLLKPSHLMVAGLFMCHAVGAWAKEHRLQAISFSATGLAQHVKQTVCRQLVRWQQSQTIAAICLDGRRTNSAHNLEETSRFCSSYFVMMLGEHHQNMSQHHISLAFTRLPPNRNARL